MGYTRKTFFVVFFNKIKDFKFLLLKLVGILLYAYLSFVCRLVQRTSNQMKHSLEKGRILNQKPTKTGVYLDESKNSFIQREKESTLNGTDHSHLNEVEKLGDEVKNITFHKKTTYLIWAITIVWLLTLMISDIFTLLLAIVFVSLLIHKSAHLLTSCLCRIEGYSLLAISTI